MGHCAALGGYVGVVRLSGSWGIVVRVSVVTGVVCGVRGEGQFQPVFAAFGQTQHCIGKSLHAEGVP